jgi:putative inorganic carbon (hco3(-)) transporter
MNFSLANKRETFWVYLVSFLFIAVNIILISNEFYYFSLIPLLLVVMLAAIFTLDKLLLVAVFVTPLSIQLSDIIEGYNFDLSLPSEALLIGILLVFLMKVLYEGKFDRRILYHPVSLAILVNLLWICITSISSTMPLVSVKFLIARIWFLVAFYLIASQLFRRYENIGTYIWVYIISFLLVIGYAWVRHSSYGFFSQQAAHFVVQPFYNDHTSYGATLAMLIPLIIAFILTRGEKSLFRRVSMWVVLAIFIVAVVFSYTRAAWISLIGALAVLIMVWLRIKFFSIAVIGLVLLGVLYNYRAEIKIQLEQNRQVSSEDLVEHVKSISNVATDASNLERLNRWSCAWRMFKEKPILGWGPGTYMFNYAPFQLKREKTEISTNAADHGNAHSEYIGPLTESGIMGTLSFLAIVILTIVTGIRNWYRIKNRNVRILSLALLLGLITYYLHGLLNNFLDTDKASALFWGYTAAIVTIDLYHRQPRKKESLT